MQAGINEALRQQPAAPAGERPTAAQWAALAVICLGALIPLFVRKPAYRIVQQLLNVGILGFWGGTFIDYAMIENVIANGVTASVAALSTIILLIVGFIYPLFNKPSHYCSWICPFGSLQELAGHCCKWKLNISPATAKILDKFRMLLWCVLLCLLWVGWCTNWIDNEIFTAFVVESASWIVIGFAIAFICLSLFVTRPFCRFVCPTGTLLHVELYNKKK